MTTFECSCSLWELTIKCIEKLLTLQKGSNSVYGAAPDMNENPEQDRDSKTNPPTDLFTRVSFYTWDEERGLSGAQVRAVQRQRRAMEILKSDAGN